VIAYQNQQDITSRILAALADPTRRTVFEQLRNSEKSVGVLARELPVSRPAVSQHLRVLRTAGLVTERREGTRNFYRADPEGLAPLRAWIEETWGEVLAAFSARAAQEGADDE
jgi:DNA-binding transcriptional ArsR family regulator